MREYVDGIAGTELWVVLVLAMMGSAGLAQENIGQIPAGEERSKEYTVQVAGRDVPVYAVKVAPADRERRWKAMDDKVRSAEYFDKAAFAYFDMSGPMVVMVTCPEPITSAKVLPSSLKIVPAVEGQRLTFSLTEPKPVTVEVNGNWVGALHLFANPPEASAPKARRSERDLLRPGRS